MKVYNKFFARSLARQSDTISKFIHFGEGFRNFEGKQVYTEKQIQKWWNSIQDSPAPRCTVSTMPRQGQSND